MTDRTIQQITLSIAGREPIEVEAWNASDTGSAFQVRFDSGGVRTTAVFQNAEMVLVVDEVLVAVETENGDDASRPLEPGLPPGVACPECKGLGVVTDDDRPPVECRACWGMGRVEWAEHAE